MMNIFKNFSFILFTISITSCNNTNNISLYHSIEPSNSKSNISPTIKPIPTPTNDIYQGLEKLDNGNYCDSKKEVELKLDKPVKLAVSNDGSSIYFINGSCGESGVDLIDKYLCKNSIYPKDNIVIRRSILKISDNDISLVKHDNQPLLNCKLGTEIEVDNQDNLYVTDYKSIFKLTPDSNLIKLADVKQKAKVCLDLKCESSYLTGVENLHFSNGNLYFIAYINNEYSELYLKILDKNNNISVLDLHYYYFDFYRSSVQNNNLFVVNQHSIEQYSLLDINKEPLRISPLITPPELNISPSDSKFITNIKINSKGEIFVNDLEKHCIWKVKPEKSLKEMTKFVGNNKPGFKDGKGSEAEFNFPTSMDFDSNDNLYVTDTGNNAIRKITPDGTVTTIYKN